MAKLFDTNTTILEHPKKRAPGLKFSIGFAILLSLIIVCLMVEKKEKYKNKNKMLAELVIMDNGNILTKKVKYATTKKIDPEDTSDVFFEVINGNDNLAKGDLVKFNHRFIQETQIEGITYCIIDASQIQYHLKSEHVKTNLLKEQ